MREVVKNKFWCFLFNFTNSQLEAVAKSEDSIQQKMELQKEVDVLRVGFEKQVGKKRNHKCPVVWYIYVNNT